MSDTFGNNGQQKDNSKSDNNYDFGKIESKWQDIWYENNIYKAIDNDKSRDKKYILTEFPYPSGSSLHVGHVFRYTVPDVYSRYLRMKGYNVMFPIGYDAFGLPTEERARKEGKNPVVTTNENVANFGEQLKKMGYGFDWERELSTTDPEYYKWTQWIFGELYRAGLVEQREVELWWCPNMSTVLANEEVLDGPDGTKISERGEHPVERKKMKQWVIKITEYADKLVDGLETPKLIFVHGFMSTAADGWFTELKQYLEKRGVEAYFDTFPNHDSPEYSEWKEFFESKYADKLGPNTILMGHSLGPALITKYLSDTGHKVGKLVYVSPVYDKVLPEIDPEFVTDVDYDKVRFLADERHIICSDNDPYHHLDSYKDLAKLLDAEMHLHKGREHFTSKQDSNPEVIDLMSSVLRDYTFWPKHIKEMQRNWVGRSTGINITYEVDEVDESLTVFTTRPDTNYGATFIVAAPEHDFVNKYKDDFPNSEEVNVYIDKVKNKTDIERQKDGKKKTGVFTGWYVTNNLNGKKLPLYIGDFVLASVGTGVVVGVPGHDDRDFEFAQAMDLEIVRVVVGLDGDKSDIVSLEQVQEKEGTMINSEFLDGMEIMEAKDAIMDYLEEQGWGERVVNYKLRDWVFSRQRYWGEPFPFEYIEVDDEHAVISGAGVPSIETDDTNYLVFDFDGVLYNGIESDVEAEVEWALANGKSREDAVRGFYDYFEKPSHGKKQNLTDEQKSSIVSKIQDVDGWRRQHVAKDSFFTEFLDQIKKIDNARIAVVSTSSEHFIKFAFDHFAFDHDFEYIYGAETSVSKEEKIAKVLSKWGVDASQAYYFTDTKTDVLELNEYLSEDRIIGCSWGYQGHDKLAEVLDTRLILDKPEHLANHFVYKKEAEPEKRPKIKEANYILVHGSPGKLEHQESGDHLKQWGPWLEQSMADRGLTLDRVELPTPHYVHYDNWAEELEKRDIHAGTTLIAHSAGGQFVTTWLTNNQRKIKKLALVTPSDNNSARHRMDRTTGVFGYDSSLDKLADEIVIFTSDDDLPERVQASKDYLAALPSAQERLIIGAKHYLDSEMGQDYVPGILDEVLPSSFKSDDKILFIHGSSTDDYLQAGKLDTDAHWIPWLERSLRSDSIELVAPQMPWSATPDYAKWSMYLDRYEYGDPKIMIGHSAGAQFLIRYIIDNMISIDSLILISPSGPETCSIESNMSGMASSVDYTRLNDLVGYVTVIYSTDDDQMIVDDAEQLINSIDCKAVRFSDRQHFDDHSGAVDFPELLLEIRSKNTNLKDQKLARVEPKMECIKQTLTKVYPDSYILELGSGHGSLSKQLQELGYDVVMSDSDERNVAHNRQQSRAILDFDLVNDYLTSQYDLIICNYDLNNLSDKQLRVVLNKIKLGLTQDGFACLSVSEERKELISRVGFEFESVNSNFYILKPIENYDEPAVIAEDNEQPKDGPQVLIASRNKAKISRFRSILPEVNWVTLDELGLAILEPEESGDTEVENSKIKAKAYYDVAGIPTFALDTGFYIDGLSDGDQAGKDVQRAAGATDQDSQQVRFEKMKNYYKSIADQFGGQVDAHFYDAFVYYDGNDYTTSEDKRGVLLTNKETDQYNIYIPIASLYLIPPSNKYIHELTDAEYRGFVEEGIKQAGAKFGLIESQPEESESEVAEQAVVAPVIEQPARASQQERYYIFDFDGVIGDTNDFLSAYWWEINGGEFGEKVEAKHFQRDYFNKPSHSKSKIMSHEEQQEIVDGIKKAWQVILQDPSVANLFEGFYSEIEKLENTKIAVVTSGYAELVKEFIKIKGKDSSIFDAFWGIEHDLSKENKIETVAKQWGVSLDKIVYFTDTKSDIIELDKFLLNTNVYACAWGYQPAEMLLQATTEPQMLYEYSDIHNIASKSLTTEVDGKSYDVRVMDTSELPLILPDVVDYEPSNDGRSPLAKTDWIDTPNGKRESDTMPNWAGSSWYFLRYCDPHNSTEFASRDKLDYWLPVDNYFGGSEHTTLHLLYSRMWHRFLYDYNYVGTPEPYQMRINGGILLAEDGTKMSKSKGNVINPDDKIESVGADALRVYINFIGPYDATVAWQENGLRACKKFLDSVWNLQSKVLSDHQDSSEVITKLHLTIKDVTDNLEGLKSNVSVARMMELTNLLKDQNSISSNTWNTLLKLLAPFAPHFADELWHVTNDLNQANPDTSIHLSEWPECDESKLVSDTQTLAVQVNGKVRAEIEMPASAVEAEILEVALKATEKYTSGKELKFSKIIPGKLVTLAVK